MTLSNTINPTETIGRYLTSRKHFSKERNEVKPEAFLPPPNLELSVYRVDYLTLDEIWEIGENRVIKAMKVTKNLYGVGKIIADDLQIDGTILSLDEPPERHCIVKNWPLDDAKQLSIAQRMAAVAEPIFK